PPPTPGTPPLVGAGPRPIVASGSHDRVTGPSSDGLALSGLAAPGLPPLPGNQSGRLRPLPAPVRGGRGGLTVAFVVLTAAAVAIGVLVVRQAVSSDGVLQRPPPAATAPPGANTSVSADSVLVDPAGYSGRPVTAVQFELQNNGLLTQARTMQGLAPTTPALCMVTDVSPAGTLRKGTVVTITCAQQ
ncbi:MAG: hypothetical protein QOG57_2249, partial [Pseudonocardiales bacterium]|nr:hypothetical protein [Pseudonocardiales bacterium]